MTRVTLPHRLGAGLVLLLSCTLVFANEVEQHLRSKYGGKILAERGFFAGEHLDYDSVGTLTGGGRAGDWTTDGFVQIQDINVSGQFLKIKAKRLVIVADGSRGFQFAPESTKTKKKKGKKSGIVEIDADSGSDAWSDEGANQVVSKIFLSPQESFADSVPIYWKTCIDDGISGKNQKCRFSSEIAAVPGMTTASQTRIASTEAQSPVASAQVGSDATIRAVSGMTRVGHGVSPPRVVHQPEPGFSEFARKARYQGVVTLAVTVDKNGLPQNIQIASPLGGGLDAKAVEALSRWRFKPAEKDGQPVDVQIAVEMDFHLY